MNKYIKEIVERSKGGRFWNEAFVDKIYKETKKRGKLGTVIDLGAAEGEFSLYIYDLARRVYAVEPHADSFETLKENSKNLPKIRPFRYIISDSNQDKFLRGNADGGAQTVDEEEDNTQRVPTRTLASFMRENNIKTVDILKIDIESHEPRVFGALDFPWVAHKIKFIIGEHGAGLQQILEPLGFHWKDGFTAWR
mgnify:CR=1 FL=1